MSNGAPHTPLPDRPDTDPSGGSVALDIVIVDYNAGPLLERCLQSIGRHLPKHTSIGRLVVVDNASVPPTVVPAIDASFPITLLRNEYNQGFARACNQGAALCSSAYLLLLNPDTELLDGSLDVPVAFLENARNARYGIVSIQLLNEDGKVSPTCSETPRLRHFVAKAFGLDRLFPSVMPAGILSSWEHGNDREVEGLIGAFFVVRRSLWDQLNGFDERFFVYFEEAEFGYRARRAGVYSYFVSSAQARHRGAGTTDAIRAERLYFSLQSRMRYASKHFGPVARLLTLVLTVLVEPASRLVGGILRRDKAGVAQTARGISLLWRWLLLKDEGPAARRQQSPSPTPIHINQ